MRSPRGVARLLAIKLLVGGGHRGAQPGGRQGHVDARLGERGDLVLRLTRAARDDRAGVAHAAAGRRGRAGDERDDGQLFCLRRDELGRHLLGVAANLTDHDDALGLRVRVEVLEAVDEVGAVERVTADANDHRLAQALRRRLVDGLVRQSARARDDRNLALAVDVARHDANLALARLDDAGAVGADQARFGLREEGLLDLDHILLRDALRDANDQRHLGLDGLQDRRRRRGRRHVQHRRVRVRLLLGLGDVLEDGQAEVGLASLLRADAADHLRAVRNRLLAVERGRLAREALADDLGVLEDRRRGRRRRHPPREVDERAAAGSPGRHHVLRTRAHRSGLL
mmetsp:Transcript_50207/g.132147  ORF Transcript_50207/g.132147 Transcript_50207/m.132147 type:complete len:342 (-) Transcript_50207:14-1039(-)